MSKRSKPETLAASDGKHYWNCWTYNYRPESDGYIIHAFCEEDRTGRALCGTKCSDGGGVSFPSEGRPSCFKCVKIFDKRLAASTCNPMTPAKEHMAAGAYREHQERLQTQEGKEPKP